MNRILLFIISIIIILVFRDWFLGDYIIGGDWPFYFPEFFKVNEFLPQSWAYYASNGLGGKVISYGLDNYLFMTYRIADFFGFQWQLGYKIFWFGLFLVVGAIGSFLLSKEIFAKKSIHIISPLIYITNTYILMVVGGGQMGVALAYSICPLVAYLFLRNIRLQNLRSLLLSSLSLGFLITFDIRIFAVFSIFISLLSFGMNKVSLVKKNNQLVPKILRIYLLPLLLAFLLNSYWLLPNLLNPYNPLEKLGSAYTSVTSLKFFSFATLSNSISLLHPNWPDNIFGKVAFQKPEFLILTILVFTSILFKSEKVKVRSLAVIALLGIFLGKGSNDPFGSVYILLFEKVPLFQMFRDSTKWYVLIAMSFSLLIPYSIYRLTRILPKKIRRLGMLLPLFFILLWAFTIREAVAGRLTGTFRTHDVPIEYIDLKDKLYNDRNFGRTLWVPRQQRFTYNSHFHPAIESSALFNSTNAAELRVALEADNSQIYLKDLSVKYVIIPFDSIGEIFLDDRKYSSKRRQEYEDVLDKISYLKKIHDGKITIYLTKSFNPLIISSSGAVNYKRINSTFYELNSYLMPNDIITFGQKFNQSWVLRSHDKKIKSVETKIGFNSFVVPLNSEKLTIEFVEQKNYNIGWLLTLLALAVSLLMYLKSKK